MAPGLGVLVMERPDSGYQMPWADGGGCPIKVYAFVMGQLNMVCLQFQCILKEKNEA